MFISFGLGCDYTIVCACMPKYCDFEVRCIVIPAPRYQRYFAEITNCRYLNRDIKNKFLVR